MANLTSYFLETDRPRGVNLLVKTYDRNATGQVLRRYLDVQVDHRDPNGRQADPHLTTIPARDSQGRPRQNHAATYGLPDFDTIEHHAGDNRQPILNERGEQIGMVYAVKGELMPSPHGDGGHFIKMNTLESSDFEVGPTTMAQQAFSARRVRQEQTKDASAIFEDELSTNAQRENTRTGLSAGKPSDNRGAGRATGAPAGVSSQAGLGVAYGPKNVLPSAPLPGTPGSRFNPIVRQRHPEASTPESADPRMISSNDVPKTRKKLRAPTAQEISAFGRVSQAAVEGARTGVQIGKAIPKLGPVVGGVVGGVVGAGHGVVREADAMAAVDAEVIEAEIVEGEQPSNPFAAAGARFGTASAGKPSPPKSPARTSYPYQYEEQEKSSDSLQFG